MSLKEKQVGPRDAQLSCEFPSQPTSSIRFVVRIRKPLESELRSEAAAKEARKGVKLPYGSKSPIVSHTQGTERQLQTTYKYCVFTTKESSREVLVSETAISGKLVNSALLTPTDIPYFACSLRRKPHIFNFDDVYSELTPPDKFYVQNVRPLVQQLMRGQQTTVVCMGPSE